MARRIADSATKMKCMKNIWDTQQPNDISMDWNQKMASILGAVAGEKYICRGQHGKEDIHGLMETALSHNHEDQEDIAYENQNIHRTDRDGDPGVRIFQSWDPSQDIPHILRTGVIIRGRRNLWQHIPHLVP